MQKVYVALAEVTAEDLLRICWELFASAPKDYFQITPL